ncbi:MULTISPECIES: DUF3885 domain-containing protein [unclassified Exiguobacterium]|uniref:DUF3885 domain-containing protein n=1 Tax=unclassified Exiguobacterium TaxID=2644629 RepID=UPI001BE6DDE0
MKEEIMKYIDNHFSNRSGEVHLRFELGEPYKNGTDERIEQVVKRVTTLFEEVFQSDDYIHIFIKDWNETEDIMFGNTTPEYLYGLFMKQQIEEETLFELDEDIDEKTGEIIEIKHEYKAKFVSSQIKSISYEKILRGIGNYEQGREPSIGQTVYFISTEKNIVFHMYDDRGCTISSNEVEPLVPLYHKYNDWLVNYWRADFDAIFKKI